MKIRHTKYFDNISELQEYLTFFHDDKFTVSYNSEKCKYTVATEEVVTIPQFHIANLSEISHDNELTTEQASAIDYGISAIKTLVDMGIIK